jgi:hypothetical protein
VRVRAGLILSPDVVPFDRFSEPPIRFHLFRLEKNRYVLQLVAHGGTIGVGSLRLLLTDLSELYKAKAAGSARVSRSKRLCRTYAKGNGFCALRRRFLAKLSIRSRVVEGVLARDRTVLAPPVEGG